MSRIIKVVGGCSSQKTYIGTEWIKFCELGLMHPETYREAIRTVANQIWARAKG